MEKYFISIDAKNGLTLLKANKKLTAGKKWTTDFSKAYYYHSHEEAAKRAFYAQYVVNDAKAKQLLNNIALQMYDI